MRVKPLIASLSLPALAAAALALTACVGYNVYPPMEGSSGFTDVNSNPFPQVMTETLRWIALRYPPSADAEWNQPSAGNVGTSPFAVNLPAGLNKQLAEKIVANVGMGAQPMRAGNDKLPTYHIARISVSGDEAYVDMIRPVIGVGSPSDGKTITQAVTVRLRGGLQPWHVTSHREWAFNALPAPALNYIPGETVPAGAVETQTSPWTPGTKPAQQ